jgi:hypothetical protein
VSERTVTADPITRAAGGEAGALSTRLVFVTTLGDPAALPASHALDELTEVRFRRGPRSVERSRGVLTLAFPDTRMSGDHGSWHRRDARWLVEDLESKNGTVIDGELARRSVLHDGAVIELGHSFFVFRHSRVAGVPPHLAGDVDAAGLPPWPAGLATFAPDLALIFAELVRLAGAPASIVLLGETGTGKDVVARAIHALSQRPGELVAVNCGALPATLVESELFGHRRGAFSGAIADRRGLIRSADRGTLFLDEIGELPAPAQAALLRVLQQREVLPVGDDRPTAVDLRVIAATLRDLDGEVAAGRFRDDLYGRISGHVAVLSPLRERKEDLGLLLAAMIDPHGGGRSARLTPAALRALLRHPWPRNLRELELALSTALSLSPDGAIDVEQLPLAVRRPRATAPPDEAAPDVDPADRALRATLIELFEQHGGNVRAVAEALGKQRPQIYKWIKRLAIDVSAFRRAR